MTKGIEMKTNEQLETEVTALNSRVKELELQSLACMAALKKLVSDERDKIEAKLEEVRFAQGTAF